MKNNFYRFKMRRADFGDRTFVTVPPQQDVEDMVDDPNASAESLGLIIQSTEESFFEKIFSDLSSES